MPSAYTIQIRRRYGGEFPEGTQWAFTIDLVEPAQARYDALQKLHETHVNGGGTPILGFQETGSTFCLHLYMLHMKPEEDHEELVSMIQRYFTAWGGCPGDEDPCEVRNYLAIERYLAKLTNEL